jgi:hypothetical protein
MNSTRSKLAASLVLIASAAISATTTAQIQAQSESTASGSMSCAPTVLRDDDKLVVTLPEKHGADFAVTRPDGTYVFIAFAQPDPKSAVQPVINSTEFSSRTSFVALVGALKGVVWEKSATGKHETVFRFPGQYTFLVGSGLEAEDKDIQGWCRVSYIGPK